jgi:hypothetical protein
MSRRILLHLNQMGERGTETSTLELARLLVSLNDQVTCTFPADSPLNRIRVIENFRRICEVKPYKDFNSSQIWAKNRFDFVYFQKVNSLDGLKYPKLFNSVHVVFPEYLPHGNSYAYVSKWLSEEAKRLSRKKFRIIRNAPKAILSGCKNSLAFNYAPLIVNLPEPESDMRSLYGIPKDAFLILRYGGFEQFDITWVKSVVVEFLESNPDAYFLGINTKEFCDHPRAIFAQPIFELSQKSNVLFSADVFLHGRARGETFGMSIVECLQIGTPIISFSGGSDKNHVQLLGNIDSENTALYANETELTQLLDYFYVNRVEGFRDEILINHGNEFRPQLLKGVYNRIFFPI